MTVSKVEKIVLDVLGTKLDLTPEQARELRDELTEILGPNVDRVMTYLRKWSVDAKDAERKAQTQKAIREVGINPQAPEKLSIFPCPGIVPEFR